VPVAIVTIKMADSDMRTFKEFLLQYNTVTEKCFRRCIVDFSLRYYLFPEMSNGVSYSGFIRH